MKRQLMIGVALVCMAAFPNFLSAQTPGNPPANQVNDPTGTPPGVMPMQNRNSTGFPAPNLKEGQPIETRQPEKEDNHPVFPGQTRAPYRASEISAARDVQALAFETLDGLHLWLANLLPEQRVVDVEGLDLTGGRLATLDAATFEACARGPEGFEGAETIHRGGALTLEPFAVARLRLSS